MAESSEEYYRRAAAAYAATVAAAKTASQNLSPSSQIVSQVVSNKLDIRMDRVLVAQLILSNRRPSKSEFWRPTPLPQNRSELGSHVAPIILLSQARGRINAAPTFEIKEKSVLDFDKWCATLKALDDSASPDINLIRSHFNAFLAVYPLCFGFWKRWALLEFKLGTSLSEADMILCRGLQADNGSVDLWLARFDLYKTAASKAEEEATDSKIRALLECALREVGGEWSSGPLWRAYIQWESEKKNWGKVGDLYFRVLSNELIVEDIPQMMTEFTDLLATFKDDFAKLVHPDEMSEYNSMIEKLEAKEEAIQQQIEARREFDIREKHKKLAALDLKYATQKRELQKAYGCDATDLVVKVEAEYRKEKMTLLKELEERELRLEKEENSDKAGRLIRQQKDLLMRARQSGYNTSSNLIERRKPYEITIRRRHYHPKPLDANQIESWRKYIEFEIAESGSSSPSRIDRLFRRCLVVCNDYPEFWRRYADWLLENDVEGVRKLLKKGRETLLPNSVALWLLSAEIEEVIADRNQSKKMNEIVINEVSMKRSTNPTLLGRNDIIETVQSNDESVNDSYTLVRNLLLEADQFKNGSDGEIILHRIAFEKRRGNYNLCKSLYQSVINPSDHSNKLPAHHKIKIAISYAYLLIEYWGDFEAARVALANCRDLKCLRKSLLLASIDIETRELTHLISQRDVNKKQIIDQYTSRVSELYENVLDDSDLMPSDIVSEIWHRYVTFIILQGVPLHRVREIEARALHSMRSM